MLEENLAEAPRHTTRVLCNRVIPDEARMGSYERPRSGSYDLVPPARLGYKIHVFIPGASRCYKRSLFPRVPREEHDWEYRWRTWATSHWRFRVGLPRDLNFAGPSSTSSGVASGECVTLGADKGLLIGWCCKACRRSTRINPKNRKKSRGEAFALLGIMPEASKKSCRLTCCTGRAGSIVTASRVARPGR